MPQSNQIVPRYNYPYVETVINNNSQVDEGIEADVLAESYPYLCVFASGKGVDNVLVSTESLQQHRSRFGKSNFKLYGQPLLQAETILSQPNTKTWDIRVMPEDALYANSALSLWYKPDYDKKVFRIKTTVKSYSKFDEEGNVIAGMEEILSNREALIEKGRELEGPEVDGVYMDDEGYIQVPAAMFTSAGRGKYGDNLSWRISRNEEYEKEYGFKIYTFECLESENGTTVLGTYTGSIVSSTKVTTTSFINDVIEDKGIENTPMDIFVYEENIETLYEAFVEFAEAIMAEDPTIDYDIPDMDCFDPFFGMGIARQKVRMTPADDMVRIVTLKTDEVDESATDFDIDDYTLVESDNPTELSSNIVDDVRGTFLYGGHDGAFTVDKVNDPTGELRQAAIEQAYIKAFSGSLDKTILSARRIPSTAIFDANFSLPVKKVMAKLALFRKDCILYLDTNKLSTLTDSDLVGLEKDYGFINELAEDFDPFYPWLISVNLHYYNTQEPTTGKRVPVTITNYLASIHANHWRTFGYHTPICNEDYATLTGHVRNSLKPSIEEYEGELMEALNIGRFNYFEAIGENRFYRATQNTWTTGETSDLTEENNVNTLLWLRRNVTDDARSELYNFTDPTSRSDFAEFVRGKYQPMVNKQIQSIDVKCTVNEWEFERSIVHVYLEVVFRQLAKRIILEIDVNKRTFEE